MAEIHQECGVFGVFFPKRRGLAGIVYQTLHIKVISVFSASGWRVEIARRKSKIRTHLQLGRYGSELFALAHLHIFDTMNRFRGNLFILFPEGADADKEFLVRVNSVNCR